VEPGCKGGLYDAGDGVQCLCWSIGVGQVTVDIEIGFGVHLTMLTLLLKKGFLVVTTTVKLEALK